VIHDSKQQDAKKLPTCLQSDVTQPLSSKTMTDRAERLTKETRKEFGNCPRWTVASTQTRLEANDSKWDIQRKYYQAHRDYTNCRPLARILHRRCKSEIGKLPAITENMIHEWIFLEYWSDFQVMAEYQEQFDKEYPDVRRAKRVLAELRRDLGHCDTVDEQKIIFWVEKNLTDERMRSSYNIAIEQSKFISRAKALQYRLGDDVSRKLKVSIPEVQNHFRKDLTENDIVKHYQEEEASKP
jgi:hypothetical protein